MRIEVTGKGYDVSDRVREHVEEKSEKLLRHFDRTQLITFKIVKHDKSGDFEVECIIDVEKHDDFVSKASGGDLFLSIDDAVNKAVRQLTDFKEKLKATHR
jgi:ribosomal subunit interface protein